MNLIDLIANSVTFGSLVYGAWAIVLSAHVGSDDVTFATTLSGRDIPVNGVELMNGPTLTTVPQRVRILRNVSTSKYISEVNDDLWSMIAHSQYGMREALRISNQTPHLFNTLVNIVMDKQTLPSTNDLFKAYASHPTWKTEYITLEVALTAGKIKVSLVSALEDRRANFIMEQFIKTFTWLVQHPNEPLSALSTTSQIEEQFLQSLANYVPATESLLHTSMEQIALNSPSSIALEWEGDSPVSYQELNSRANRLAFLLRARGVRPDSNTLVPLCLDK